MLRQQYLMTMELRIVYTTTATRLECGRDKDVEGAGSKPGVDLAPGPRTSPQGGCTHHGEKRDVFLLQARETSSNVLLGVGIGYYRSQTAPRLLINDILRSSVQHIKIAGMRDATCIRDACRFISATQAGRQAKTRRRKERQS